MTYYPSGPIPHNLAKTFDGPPTLERSGSEHRVGRFTSFLLRRKAWLEVELPLAKGRRRDSKDSFLNGKEGLVGFRKKPFLMVKKDGMILELLIKKQKLKQKQ